MYCRHLAGQARLSLSESLAELIFADQDLDYVLLISCGCHRRWKSSFP
jgi:hypothetical protein